MYLYLAIFWFSFGVVMRIFWSDLEPHLRDRNIGVNRDVILFVCFVLFCYNMVRWRMTRALKQALERAKEEDERPKRRNEVVDPTFDFSDPKPEDNDKAQG